jgi:cytoskeletal protein RodZ
MDRQALGRYLREAREGKELTLDEAVDALKIRRYILESFEQGEFNALDASPVQIRGFIRNYARYLRLDEDLVLTYYESALQPDNRRRGRKQDRRRSRRATQEASTAPRSMTDTSPSPPRMKTTLGEQRASSQQRLSSLLSTLVMVLVAGAALAVIVFVLAQLVLQSEDPIQPESRDILGQLPPTGTFTAAPSPTPRATITALPQAAAQQQTFAGMAISVTIETDQRTWMRVTTDGNEQIARMVLPGEILDYGAQNEVFVAASNANALLVTYNGQRQGSFGGRGQAVDITFTRENISIVTGPGFDPTSEFTPTPLPTQDFLPATLLALQTPSNTPGPSPTPSDTPTITPTPTDTPTPSDTPTITNTPTDTLTPTNTPTATNTPTITPTPTDTLTPTPTAILPPRRPADEPTPTKEGA